MNSQKTTVELYIEINENIYNCIQDFLSSNPQWDRKLLIEASMSLFFQQNYQSCSKTSVHSVCVVPE
ncbi:MAG TPA: DUF2811 domain-containing protein [Coleofasciculaceae cyanobacterium]|jgi:hypothetical protein